MTATAIADREAVPRVVHNARVDDLMKQIDDLNNEVGDLELKIEELERKAARGDVDGTEDKINALLDLVDRPVGAPKCCKLHPSAALDRAVMALFDAVGRNP